jgi:hypothetical protein
MSICLPIARQSFAPALARRVRTVVAAAQTLTPQHMAAADLLAGFESLGDNCEFGGLQKLYGVDAPTLFKWRATNAAMLSDMIAKDLAGLDDIAQLSVELHQGDPTKTPEFMLFHALYGVHSHTFTLMGEAEPEVVLQRQHRQLVMLKRKFLQDMAAGRRIYVFRSLHGIDMGEARTLARQLRRRAPNTLLCVRLADDINRPGSVVRAGEGLLVGHLDVLAPYEAGIAPKSRLWLPMLKRARRLAFEGASL